MMRIESYHPSFVPTRVVSVLGLLAMAAVAALLLTANPAEAAQTPPAGAELPATQQAVPTLSISPASVSVNEGGWANFAVSASPAPSGSLTVHYTVSQNGDFVASSHLGNQTVQIQGVGATITVPTVDDDAFEFDGSVVVTLQARSGYTLSGSGSATVAVVNNEVAPLANIYPVAASVQEGSPARFTVNVGGDTSLTRTLNYRVAQNGEYVRSGDLGLQTLTFTDSHVIINVPTVDDRVVEDDGAVMVMLLPGDGYRLGDPNAAWTTVTSDDTPAEVELHISYSIPSFNEGSIADFEISANPAPTGSLTVNYHLMQRGDHVQSKYLGARTLTLTGSSATLAVPTVDDNTAEPAGAVILQLLPGAGYTLGAPVVSVSTILDNDEDLPEVSVSGGGTVSEGDPASYVFSVNPAPSGSLTLHYTVSQNGGYADDLQLGARTVTVSDATTTMTVPTIDDTKGKEDGSITVAINPDAAYLVGVPDSASVTVQNNDAIPTITVTTDAQNIAEGQPGGDTAVITIRASGPSRSAPIDITYTVTDTSTQLSEGKLGTFTKTLGRHDSWVELTPYHLYDDQYDEEDGTFTVTIQPGDGYVVGNPSSVSVNVKDNDTSRPTLSLSSSQTSVTEGAAVRFDLSASVPFEEQVTVNYDVNMSVSTADFVDSTELGSQTLILPAGSSGTTIIIPTINDAVDEEDALIWVSLRKGQGYVISNKLLRDSVAILDNDAESEISVTAGSSVVEGGTVSFTINANPPTTGNVPVRYRLTQQGNYAAAGSLGTKTVNLNGASATVTVATVNDDNDEADGSVTILILDGKGYRSSPPGDTADVAVGDNDDRQYSTVSISGPTTIAEGSSATYTITANPTPDASLVVKYRVRQQGKFVSNGQLGVKSVSLTGASATVTVPTVNDSVAENNGVVTVEILTDNDYTRHGSDYVAYTTVTDDDSTASTPVLSLSGGATIVEGENASFTVTASPAPSGSLTVSYTVSEAGDHVASGGLGDKTASLTFTNGVASITVPTVDDSAEEASAEVRVRLNPSSAYKLASRVTGSILVEDNDSTDPLIRVDRASDTIVEGATAQFTITADRTPTSPIVVNFYVWDDEGRYTATGATGDSTITMTGTTATITVTTVNDDADEPDGYVGVTLMDGAGYLVNLDFSMDATMVEDDDE